MAFPPTRYRALITIIALLIIAACRSNDPAKEPKESDEIIVAAASDLIPAFEELGQIFERETGTKVTFMFGSTGNLTRQIEHGAPVDLFAAANISFIEELNLKGFIISDTMQLYARGRIALWTHADSSLNLQRIEDLARPDVKRIAIANPGHAPYGVAAREAMERVGIWNSVQPKLVLAENVRQALQYGETGNVDAAIVALSLSLNSDGRWQLIAEELHNPLDQALAVIKHSKHEEEARRFADFINSPQGRSVMRKYGFILPGEEPVH
jgi:molybdate transport system substrate-binding protein